MYCLPKGGLETNRNKNVYERWRSKSNDSMKYVLLQMGSFTCINKVYRDSLSNHICCVFLSCMYMTNAFIMSLYIISPPSHRELACTHAYVTVTCCLSTKLLPFMAPSGDSVATCNNGLLLTVGLNHLEESAFFVVLCHHKFSSLCELHSTYIFTVKSQTFCRF